MVTPGSTMRYYVWRGWADMRKSFDGLQGLVVSHLGRTGMEGEVHVFFNRRRTQVKFLVWDRTGFVICHKRLERGRFEGFDPGGEGRSGPISWADLQLVLEGVDLCSARRRKRYLAP